MRRYAQRAGIPPLLLSTFLFHAIPLPVQAVQTTRDPHEAARQLISQGDWSQAAAVLEERVRTGPPDAESYYLLGFTYTSQALSASDRRALLERAAVALRRSLDLQPGRPDALNELGNVQNLLGNYDAAILNYREALTVAPDWPMARFNLADALTARGDVDAAIAEYQRLLDGRGTGAMRAEKVRTALAQAYLRAGRLDDAERALREVIARTPEYVDAHIALGNLLVERRELGPATVAYEQAASLRPQDPQLAFTVCQLYLFRRRDEQALDWLERAVKNGLPDRQSLRGQGLFKRLENYPRFLELTQ